MNFKQNLAIILFCYLYFASCSITDGEESCFRQWKNVGTLLDIPKVFQYYPVTKYQYGVIYNGPMVMPVIINQWNRGLRVTTRDVYPSGDRSDDMKPVRAMWTKGTDDIQSKGKNWYHNYVDLDYKSFGSNGESNPALYVRRM